jgi:formate-dependent nitrite reductase membrane component NrfD
MELALFTAAFVAWLVVRGRARRWITERWLDDRVSNLQAGLLFLAVHLGPALVILFAVLASLLPSAPMLTLAIVPALVLMIGLVSAAVDYLSSHGTKEVMKRERAQRRS